MVNPMDEYTRIRDLQNKGLLCPHCNAGTGHYDHCVLLGRHPSDFIDKLMRSTDRVIFASDPQFLRGKLAHRFTSEPSPAEMQWLANQHILWTGDNRDGDNNAER